MKKYYDYRSGELGNVYTEEIGSHDAELFFEFCFTTFLKAFEGIHSKIWMNIVIINTA